jgi:lysophospholipase L1-like esterase
MSLIAIISALGGGSTGTSGGGGAVDLNNSVMVFDGNSLTAGQGASAGMDYPSQLIALLTSSGVAGMETHNFGVSGQQTGSMIADAATQIDPLINVGVQNILFAWEIGNDIYYNGNAVNAENAFQTYCEARRAAGWKVIVFTCPPRNNTTPAGDDVATYNTKLSASNTWIRTNYASFADALVDLAADSRLSDYTNMTYYYTDGVHLSNNGYGVVAELAKNQLLLL